jgi:hypothetical protein
MGAKLPALRVLPCGLALLLGSAIAAQSTWRRAYGALDDDRARVVRVVDQDRFVVAGSTGSFGAGASDIYLLMLDADGDVQWSRTIGLGGVDVANDMVVLSDGGLVLAGTSTSGGAGGYDGYLVRTDANGVVVWQRWFGGADWDFFRDIRVIDDELILTGQTFSNGSVAGSAWLLRVDLQGALHWSRSYDLEAASEGAATVVTTDGGYVMTGAIDEPSDVFVLKLDVDGEQEWFTRAGGDSVDVGLDVITTLDGGYSVVGTTRSWSEWEEGYHIKFDAMGNEQWFRHWGQINDQGSNEHVQLVSGHYMTVGYTKTSGGGGKDMFLLKSEPNGDFSFGRTFGGSGDEIGYGLAILPDGFICAGSTDGYGSGGVDVFVVRTDGNGATQYETVEDAFDPTTVGEVAPVRFTIHPNPSVGEVFITGMGQPSPFALLDKTGRIVDQGVAIPREPVAVHHLADGTYVLRLDLPDGSFTTTRITILRP